MASGFYTSLVVGNSYKSLADLTSVDERANVNRIKVVFKDILDWY